MVMLGEFGATDLSTLVSDELPPLPINNQLINLLREAGIDYDSSTKEFKITDEDYPAAFRLTKDNLITEKFGELFYNKLKTEINLGYKLGLYSSVVVLCRKLVENLLIDILRKKYPRNKKGNLKLYFDKNGGRFHDFGILIDNLEKTEGTI